MSDIKLTTGIDNTITINILDTTGLPQDLTSCTAMFYLSYKYEDDSVISPKAMNIYPDGKCVVSLSPAETNVLARGEYQMQVKITDINNKIHGTERIDISVDKTIG